MSNKREVVDIGDLDAVIERDLKDVESLPSLKDNPKANHYVDNKRLLKELSEYALTFKQAKEKGLPRPKMPEYIGKCILLIAEHMAMRPNFSGYSYIEEMRGDAIINAVNYVHNFDSTKSSNAFAYVSQQIWNAFVRRIRLEQKQYAGKLKILNMYGTTEEAFDTQDHDDSGEYHNTYVEYLQANNEFLDEYEQKMEKKRDERRRKRTREVTSLESFIDGEDNENSDNH